MGGLPAQGHARVNLVAACSFILGGASSRSVPPSPSSAIDLLTVNVTYLVGGFFFSLGGYLSIVLAPASSDVSGSSQSGAARLAQRGRPVRGHPALRGQPRGGLRRRGSRRGSPTAGSGCPTSSAVLCFLVSGHLAMLEVGDGRVRVRADVLGWWVVAVNQLGSVLFFLAGLAAFTRPATDQAINVGLVNWGTFAGATVSPSAGSSRHSTHPLRQERWSNNAMTQAQ